MKYFLLFELEPVPGMVSSVEFRFLEELDEAEVGFITVMRCPDKSSAKTEERGAVRVAVTLMSRRGRFSGR